MSTKDRASWGEAAAEVHEAAWKELMRTGVFPTALALAELLEKDSSTVRLQLSELKREKKIDKPYGARGPWRMLRDPNGNVVTVKYEVSVPLAS